MRLNRLACVLAFLCLSVGRAAEPAPFDSEPKSPQASLDCLRTRDHLRVELVAAEPLVADPIAMAWGPDGRLWVVEMGDYPINDKQSQVRQGRIRFLTDTNRDGRYDTSTIFLDGLSFPTGVMPWREGVLVTCAPEIFYAEDTNHDGRADRRETWYRGFNTGNPQHTVNGLRWGLDNWIHIANGDLGGVIEAVKTGHRKDIFGHDFRIHPETGRLELETGMSQFGRCRDDWRNWFGGNSAQPLWHNVIEDRYLVRNSRYMPPNPAVALTEKYPPVTPISRPHPRLNEFGWHNRITSACGLCVYRDDQVAQPGAVFICEPAQNLVHQRTLHRSQSTFVSRTAPGAEFLASTDTWFRPTQVRTGPDGALYVVDMYRLVIEHPDYFELDPQQGDPAPPSAKKLRAGNDRGRIYRVIARDQSRRNPPRLGVDPAQWVAALDSPNGPQRDIAHQWLVQRHAVEQAPAIRELFLKTSHANRRLQALCTLDGLGKLDDPLLAAALRDKHPAIRRHAIWLSEQRLTQDSVQNQLLKMAADPDPDPQVRLQLACTLGQWHDRRAGDALAEMLVRDASDPHLVAAVMSAAETHVQWILPGVIRYGADSARHLPLVKELLPSALGAEQETVLVDTLGELASQAGEDGRLWRWKILQRLLLELDRQAMTLSDWRRNSGAKLQAAIEALAPLFAAARETASNTHRSSEERVLAVSLLGRGLANQATDLQQLRDLLSSDNVVEVQLAVVDRLAATDLEEVPQWLLTDFAQRSPRLRAAILDALLSRKDWTTALLDAVESEQLAAADLGAVHRDRLVLHYYATIRRRASQLLGQANQARQTVVANYRPALQLPGDVRRGEVLFTQHCAACHRRPRGDVQLAPDLTNLTDRTRETLLIDILNPNRRVDPKSLSYVAVSDTGRIYNGIIAHEAGSSLRIVTAEGKTYDLNRNDLEALKSTGLSLMPEGLERLLPEHQDVADLIAYLRKEKP